MILRQAFKSRCPSGSVRKLELIYRVSTHGKPPWVVEKVSVGYAGAGVDDTILPSVNISPAEMSRLEKGNGI